MVLDRKMPSLALSLDESTTATARPERHSSASLGSSVLPPRPTVRRKPSAGILTTTTSASGGRTTRLTTTTAAATPAPKIPSTASATNSASDRPPLRIRDQNVTATRGHMKQSPGLRINAPTTRMPYEKSSPSTTRPLTVPSVARGINKQPLTPKVASRIATPQLQSPPVATPLARRGAARSDLVLGSNGTVPREKEELVSPAPGLLSNNITPRSGLRQIRVDSANSTPTGTPVPERHDLWETRSGIAVSTAAIDDALRRPTVTFGPPVEPSSCSRQEADSKLFYAFDAQRPTQQTAAPKPLLTQQKTSTFFYANGETVPPRSNAPVLLTPLLAVSTPSQESPTSKFVYANGVPDLPPSPKPGVAQPIASGSVVSTLSRIPPSRQGAAVTQAPYSSPRPSSPVKLGPHSQVKQPVIPVSQPTRSPVATPNPLAGQPFQRSGRPGMGHGRSGSLTNNLTIAEPPAVARILSVHGSLSVSETHSLPSSPIPVLEVVPTNSATTGFSSLLQAAEDFADEEVASPESLDSPTKSISQEQQLADLVVSARRERKVQDLEITNASLEAINRTLERQLRKQTAEIRRYRRFSRPGRLSMGSVGSRLPSDASTVDGGALARAGMDLDDLSEEESDMEAQEEEMDEEEDFSSSETSGDSDPGAARVRDARHRQRDELRLQLDLSKHQQLLIDSQKINQSLKRCLGWTEELIKEGKRALEYRVRVSDVEIGGRVLAPEDLEAREAREAEVVAGDENDDADEDITLHGTAWSKEPQDRDSGIELPADGG